MKCKIRHQAKWLVLAAILLSGCSGDDSPETGAKGPEICLNADVGQVKAETRLTSVDNAGDMQNNGEIVLSAYFNNSSTKAAYFEDAKFSYNTPFWQGSGTHYYWPIDGSILEGVGTPSLDFVGYWPADATDSSVDIKDRYYIQRVEDPESGEEDPTYIPYYDPVTGNFIFKCDMSSVDQDDIREFMYAITTNQTYAGLDGDALPLVFRHPFARIKFQLSAASVSAGVTFDNVGNYISVSGLMSQGKYTYTSSSSSEVWSELGGPLEIRLDKDHIGDAPFVIPFSGTIRLTVNADWSVWGEKTSNTVSTDLTVDWSPGTSYTYTLTITPSDLTVDTQKFTEQW